MKKMCANRILLENILNGQLKKALSRIIMARNKFHKLFIKVRTQKIIDENL
jgi:hypothetical protein